jgi:cell division protein FtsA
MQSATRTHLYADEERPPQALAPLVAALDVGVSKTVCLAARRDPVLDLHPERPIRVLGVGQQTAPAIASGTPADFSACARAIAVAIAEAARMAGAPIHRVTACYSGPGLAARISRGAVRVRGKVVTPREVNAAIDAALAAAPAPSLSVLHVEPLRYSIDDGEPVEDPIGFSGRALAVEVCIVTAPTEALNALQACIRAAGVEVDDIVAAPRAAAIAVMSREERAAGALLVDLGAGSIGLAAFAGEGLVHAETIAAGGVRLTRDLAQRLETTFAAAERVKLTFAAVRGACDPREAVPAPKLGLDGRLEAASVLRGAIADTMTPRLVEMLLAVRASLARAGFTGANAPARAVLVGGGAQIPGVRDLAIDALSMPVRIGRPLDLSGFDHGEAGPAYAAAAGLLRWRLDTPTIEDAEQSFQPSLARAAAAMSGSALGAWNWLKENF